MQEVLNNKIDNNHSNLKLKVDHIYSSQDKLTMRFNTFESNFITSVKEVIKNDIPKFVGSSTVPTTCIDCSSDNEREIFGDSMKKKKKNWEIYNFSYFEEKIIPLLNSNKFHEYTTMNSDKLERLFKLR
jgi:hypothetical protein